MSIWHDKLKDYDKRLMIVSGGQRGVDQAGLAAAIDWKLPTGGWVPKGWITRNGPMPQLSKLGCIEHKSPKYSPRTYANVKDSDGTIRLAYDFTTPGERCTKKAIDFYEKPWYDINLNDPDFIFDVTKWIDDNNIHVLNIAGNGGSTKAVASAIFKETRSYLSKIFRAYSE
ncbi:MAG: YpsA SLOG family protein [bacterium]